MLLYDRLGHQLRQPTEEADTKCYNDMKSIVVV